MIRLIGYIAILFSVAACSSTVLTPMQKLTNTSCIHIHKTLTSSEKSIASCEWSETRLQKARRLHQMDGNLVRAIDNTILYLHGDPNSPEAQKLLSELKIERLAKFTSELDYALIEGNYRKVWQMSKEIEYLEKQFAPYSPLDPKVVTYLKTAPRIQQAAQKGMRQVLMTAEPVTVSVPAPTQVVHARPKVDVITGDFVKKDPYVDPVTSTMGAVTGLMGASCRLTHNPTICRDYKNARKTFRSNLGPYQHHFPFKKREKDMWFR